MIPLFHSMVHIQQKCIYICTRRQTQEILNSNEVNPMPSVIEWVNYYIFKMLEYYTAVNMHK